MLITKELIESLKTPNGGYDRWTLGLLGVKWPPRKGWKEGAIGKKLRVDLLRKEYPSYDKYDRPSPLWREDEYMKSHMASLK